MDVKLIIDFFNDIYTFLIAYLSIAGGIFISFFSFLPIKFAYFIFIFTHIFILTCIFAKIILSQKIRFTLFHLHAWSFVLLSSFVFVYLENMTIASLFVLLIMSIYMLLQKDGEKELWILKQLRFKNSIKIKALDSNDNKKEDTTI